MCIISIGASAIALTTIAAIMHGFEYHTYHQLQSVHPDVTMFLPKHPISADTIEQLETYATSPDTPARHISPYARAHAILYNHRCQRFHAVYCCAVDPDDEQETTALYQRVQYPADTSLNHILMSPGIMIGSALARYIRVAPGDTVYLGHASEHADTQEPELIYTTVMVSGIYETGIEEQDMYLTYMSHESYEDMWDDIDISHIGVSIEDTWDEDTAISAMQDAFPHVRMRSWKDAYPALLSALSLEKYAMISIFSLMIILASISSISLLYMLIHTQSRECAILHIMGMPMKRIQQYLICFSCMCSTIASSCGIIIGACMSWMIDTYQIIPLPDAYHVSHLPAHITGPIIALLWLITLGINIVAAWLPSRMVYTISPARILKERT